MCKNFLIGLHIGKSTFFFPLCGLKVHLFVVSNSTIDDDFISLSLLFFYTTLQIRYLRENEPTKVTDELYALASGPEFWVCTYPGCVVDGVRFLIEAEDKNRTTQNSGVCAFQTHEGEFIDLKGALRSIFELNYMFGYRIIVFKCKWFKTEPNDTKMTA